MKSKFSWVSWFPSCSRSDGSLEPVTSSFPAASDSLRANSHSSAVVQPVRPLTRSLSPVRVLSGKARGHRANQQQSTRPTYDPGWKFIPGNRRALSSLYKSLPLPAPARESAVFAPASPSLRERSLSPGQPLPERAQSLPLPAPATALNSKSDIEMSRIIFGEIL